MAIVLLDSDDLGTARCRLFATTFLKLNSARTVTSTVPAWNAETVWLRCRWKPKERFLIESFYFWKLRDKLWNCLFWRASLSNRKSIRESWPLLKRFAFQTSLGSSWFLIFSSILLSYSIELIYSQFTCQRFSNDCWKSDCQSLENCLISHLSVSRCLLQTLPRLVGGRKKVVRK